MVQDLSNLMKNNSGTRWGNKFGMLLLPTYYHKGGADPLSYLKRAKTMIDSKKLTLEGHFSYKIGDLVMSLFGAKVIIKKNLSVFPVKCFKFYVLHRFVTVILFSLNCRLRACLITGLFVIQPSQSQMLLAL